MICDTLLYGQVRKVVVQNSHKLFERTHDMQGWEMKSHCTLFKMSFAFFSYGLVENNIFKVLFWERGKGSQKRVFAVDAFDNVDNNLDTP